MKNTAVFELQSQDPLDEKLTSLITKCSNNDGGALAELYQLTSANLFGTQVRILGMSLMAERALHDTYLRIWLKSSEYSDDLGKPMSWLTSIARNHALNLKRARRAGTNSGKNLDNANDAESEYIDTSFLAHNYASRPLKDYLDRLDINTRDSIIRSYLDGWSIEELSEAYNKPVDSLKQAMHEAMMSLREQV